MTPEVVKAESLRRAIVEGNHRAVEIVEALEAGRDAKSEVTAFKEVMTAKRLDDILTTASEEQGYRRPERNGTATELTDALANEPDSDIASRLLSDYLQTVASQFVHDRIRIKDVSARVEFVGRNDRIMSADFPEKRDKNAAPTLCKCTGVTDSDETKVCEWNSTLRQWSSEQAITDEEEHFYIIDGREIGWDEFGHMLMSFEGWQFKLTIADNSEEL